MAPTYPTVVTFVCSLSDTKYKCSSGFPFMVYHYILCFRFALIFKKFEVETSFLCFLFNKKLAFYENKKHVLRSLTSRLESLVAMALTPSGARTMLRSVRKVCWVDQGP